MGDLRSTFTALGQSLVAAGYRVAAFDLRGHGDSDTTFATFDDVAAATDAIALIEHLGGPAVLVGNSMGAGAGVWAATERPDLVSGLALLGAFVRDPQLNPLVGAAMKVAFAGMLARPWGPAMWRSYFGSLFPTRKGPQFERHRDAVMASLARPGRWAAFRATTRTTHEPAHARLAQVAVPTVVVMGSRDRDWPDPAAEARFIADAVHGRAVMVDGAGHYPQAEFPDVTGPEVVALAQEAFARA
jgi:pimeloyl-ACP methyl ester carboxylesterase